MKPFGGGHNRKSVKRINCHYDKIWIAENFWKSARKVIIAKWKILWKLKNISCIQILYVARKSLVKVPYNSHIFMQI